MQGIALHGGDVGKFSRFKTADAFLHPHQFGAHHGCRAQHILWRESKLR